MAALAVAVGLSALTIGAILSTALLIGPAATALRLTRRIGWAIAMACAIGVGATWLGVLLAYDSYDWSSTGQGYPVSFFIVALIFVVYLVSGLPSVRAASRGRRRAATGTALAVQP
jgi:zinc/manganese transport system permease protein